MAAGRTFVRAVMGAIKGYLMAALPTEPSLVSRSLAGQQEGTARHGGSYQAEVLPAEGLGGNGPHTGAGV